MTKKANVISTVGLGMPQNCEIEDHERVSDLIEKVAQTQAIDPSAIQLLNNGQPLDRNASLKQVKDGSTVKAMPDNPNEESA